MLPCLGHSPLVAQKRRCHTPRRLQPPSTGDQTGGLHMSLRMSWDCREYGTYGCHLLDRGRSRKSLLAAYLFVDASAGVRSTPRRVWRLHKNRCNLKFALRRKPECVEKAGKCGCSLTKNMRKNRSPHHQLSQQLSRSLCGNPLQRPEGSIIPLE